MIAIPEDIIEAARKIAIEPVADVDGNCLAYFTGAYTERCVKVVALAILRERERCARIAREEAVDPFVVVRILSADPPPATTTCITPISRKEPSC